MKSSLKVEQVKKLYFSKTKNSTIENINFFKFIQRNLCKSAVFVHFSVNREFHIDLDLNKNAIDDIIYYVYNDYLFSLTNAIMIYLFKKTYNSFFFNRFLWSTKSRYWSIKFEVIELVWVLRKICYLIEFSKYVTVVYTDHKTTLNIVK